MNDSSYAEAFEQLSRRVREHLASAPGCHDFDHILRVLRNARILAAQEAGANKRLVELGALLHDIARPEEMTAKGKLCHAHHGSIMAPDFLKKCGFNDTILCEQVCACIRRHRYRGKDAPQSIEEKIIYDADKLDSIGAVGIGRAFHFAGRIGARLHNSEKEALNSESYSQEDSAYREYLVKLRHIPERMLTESGRALAIRRARFMHNFFDTLNEEVFAPQIPHH